MSDNPYVTPDDVCEIGWRYARDVVEQRIDAGQLVRQACQRALDRLASPADGHHFDEDAAARPVLFARFVCHLKGPLAGEPIWLQPWQIFLTTQIYGWLDADGFRTTRSAYIEIPRKSGKSTLCAVLALFHLFADGEASAEVYSAATSRDQAKIVFGDARAMVLASPDLSGRLEVQKNSIAHLQSNSVFIPLSAEAGTLEGKNPSFSVVDELHVHKSPEVYDVLNVATGARSQPLLFAITTAGTNRQGVCFAVRDYATKVLGGHIDDDSFFSTVYTIDDDDDWRDPSVWQKANPAWGVSVQPDDLTRLAKQAQENASAETNFRTKRLNEWRNSSNAWIRSDVYEASGADVEKPDLSYWKNKPCFIGLDLASVSDFACIGLVFEEDGFVFPYLRNFLPLDTIQEKAGLMGATYRSWLEDGHIIATDGSVTDLAYIKDDLLKLCEQHDVREIAYDPYGATELSASLLDQGLPMVKHGQGIMAMTDPSKEFEKLILSGKLVHGGDPILGWMVSNTVVYQDVNENIKIKKDADSAKIDGVIALVMAIGRLKVNGGLVKFPYAERGFRTL